MNGTHHSPQKAQPKWYKLTANLLSEQNCIVTRSFWAYTNPLLEDVVEETRIVGSLRVDSTSNSKVRTILFCSPSYDPALDSIARDELSRLAEENVPSFFWMHLKALDIALKQGRITMRLAVTIPMSISMMAIVRGVIEVSVVSECQHAGKLTTSRTRKS